MEEIKKACGPGTLYFRAVWNQFPSIDFERCFVRIVSIINELIRQIVRESLFHIKLSETVK